MFKKQPKKTEENFTSALSKSFHDITMPYPDLVESESFVFECFDENQSVLVENDSNDSEFSGN